jgi:hypothetical protein
VCLLSGGVDSLVGGIDTTFVGSRPVFVSQVAQGDSSRQRQFSQAIKQNLTHIQLTHAINPPGKAERSQRARSMVFLAYGVLAASVLPKARNGETVDLLVPENGFISLNIPLTPLRLGSLSTRTTHPFFIRQIQQILDASGFPVRLSNPYQHKTKGEMLIECSDQNLLRQLVFQSTSCGRFGRHNFQHCGRCVPCLVRRAAMFRGGVTDTTHYRHDDLSIRDNQHRDFDEVRSATFAVLKVASVGIEGWGGGALNHALLGDISPYADVAGRGISEIRNFLEGVGVL